MRFPVGPVSAKLTSRPAISRRAEAAGGLGRHPDPLALHGAAEPRSAPPNQGRARADIGPVYINYRRPKGKRMDVIQYSVFFIAAQFV
jgi:hypothetical protein